MNKAVLSGLAILAGSAVLALASAVMPRANLQSAPPVASEKPQRIVSTNLCTDQLLLQMVEPERILSLSYLSRDRRTSAMAQEALHFPINHGQSEEIIALKPDLVLAGTFSGRDTSGILRKLGYSVVDFAPANTFDGIRENIRKLGDAVGRPERAAEMIAEIDAALAAVPQYGGARPLYTDYEANGWVSGPASLTGQVATLAGFRTVGEAVGLPSMGQVSLEQMLTLRPDVIDLGDDFGAPALATELFRHPALQKLLRDADRIGVPSRYTACGNLNTLKALDLFVEARRKMS